MMKITTFIFFGFAPSVLAMFTREGTLKREEHQRLEAALTRESHELSSESERVSLVEPEPQENQMTVTLPSAQARELLNVLEPLSDERVVFTAKDVPSAPGGVDFKLHPILSVNGIMEKNSVEDFQHWESIWSQLRDNATTDGSRNLGILQAENVLPHQFRKECIEFGPDSGESTTIFISLNEKITIIAVRHGESEWNERKNAKAKRKNKDFRWLNPFTWSNPDRSWADWRQSWRDSVWFWENWYGIGLFADAPLNQSGLDQAEKIHKQFEDGTSETGWLSRDVSDGTWLRDQVDAGRVAFAMSNLKRAQATLKIGFRKIIPKAGPEKNAILVMSDLQESEGGSDAACSRSKAQMEDAFALEDVGSQYRNELIDTPGCWGSSQARIIEYGRTFGYDFTHNHDGLTSSRGWRPRWFNAKTRAHRSLETFFELHRDRQQDIFVFAGHSHQIRNMMEHIALKKFSGLQDWAENGHAKKCGVHATKDKLHNGGLMKFEVERRGDGSFRIVEDSWSEPPYDEANKAAKLYLDWSELASESDSWKEDAAVQAALTIEVTEARAKSAFGKSLRDSTPTHQDLKGAILDAWTDAGVDHKVVDDALEKVLLGSDEATFAVRNRKNSDMGLQKVKAEQSSRRDLLQPQTPSHWQTLRKRVSSRWEFGSAPVSTPSPSGLRMQHQTAPAADGAYKDSTIISGFNPGAVAPHQHAN